MIQDPSPLANERSLAGRIALVPRAGPDRALAEDLLNDALAGEGGDDLAAILAAAPRVREFVVAVASDSPYLREIAFRDPAGFRACSRASRKP